MPGSLLYAGFAGSSVYAVVSVPLVMSEPLFVAIVRNASVADTEFVITWAGFQPSFVAITYAWIVGVGVPKRTSVSAPDAFRRAICVVGAPAVRSNGWVNAICVVCCAVRPAFRPRR